MNNISVTVVSESYTEVHVIATNGPLSISLHTRTSMKLPSMNTAIVKKHDPFALSNWDIRPLSAVCANY